MTVSENCLKTNLKKELLLLQEFFRKGVSSGWCLFERTVEK